MAIGAGLYSLMGPSTRTAQWIGYEIVTGCGNGLGATIVSNFRKSEILTLGTDQRVLAHTGFAEYPTN